MTKIRLEIRGFGESLLEYWDFLRIPAFLYLMKYFYDKFKSYTDRHRLGFSIILLFSILFFSIVITMFVENEDPLNAVVMVSNAFTSNGYAILGDTTGGKIDSIIRFGADIYSPVLQPQH